MCAARAGLWRGNDARHASAQRVALQRRNGRSCQILHHRTKLFGARTRVKPVWPVIHWHSEGDSSLGRAYAAGHVLSRKLRSCRPLRRRSLAGRCSRVERPGAQRRFAVSRVGVAGAAGALRQRGRGHGLGAPASAGAPQRPAGRGRAFVSQAAQRGGVRLRLHLGRCGPPVGVALLSEAGGHEPFHPGGGLSFSGRRGRGLADADPDHAGHDGGLRQGAGRAGRGLQLRGRPVGGVGRAPRVSPVDAPEFHLGQRGLWELRRFSGPVPLPDPQVHPPGAAGPGRGRGRGQAGGRGADHPGAHGADVSTLREDQLEVRHLGLRVPERVVFRADAGPLPGQSGPDGRLAGGGRYGAGGHVVAGAQGGRAVGPLLGLPAGGPLPAFRDLPLRAGDLGH